MTRKDITEIVTNKRDAQQIIAELLLEYSGNAAYDRMMVLSKKSKQNITETALRSAGNLLKSFVLYKPGGGVL